MSQTTISTPLLVLYLVVIPLAVIALIFVLVYASGRRGAKRYRPGRSYSFAPVWFLSRPDTTGPQAGHAEVTAHASARELTPHDASHAEVDVDQPGTVTPPKSAGLTGGASDRW